MDVTIKTHIDDVPDARIVVGIKFEHEGITYRNAFLTGYDPGEEWAAIESAIPYLRQWQDGIVNAVYYYGGPDTHSENTEVFER